MLHGRIMSLSTDALEMETSFAGIVTIDPAHVEGVSTERPALISLADGPRLEGALAYSADKAWRIRLGLRNHFNNQPAPGNEELDTFYTVSLAYDIQ